MRLREIEDLCRSMGLMGLNIHINEGSWSVWTRKKDCGWVRSGSHESLEEAVRETFDLASELDPDVLAALEELI